MKLKYRLLVLAALSVLSVPAVADQFTGSSPGTRTISADNYNGNLKFTVSKSGTNFDAIYVEGVSGYVGIGTSAPRTSLEVLGATTVTGDYGTVSPGASALTFGSAGTSPNAASVAWGDNSGWKLNFGTKVAGVFTPRMTIVDTGVIGIGTSSPSGGDLDFGGDSNRTLQVDRSTGTAGSDFNVTAGGAKIGATNALGGNLVLSSGTSTGQGGSSIIFRTAQGLTSGTTDRVVADRVKITPGGTLNVSNGSESFPGVSFINDTDTGIYSPSNNANEIGFATSGTLRANINNSGIRANGISGTVSLPSYSFTNDIHTGLYNPGTSNSNILNVAAGGSEALSVSGSGISIDQGGFFKNRVISFSPSTSSLDSGCSNAGSPPISFTSILSMTGTLCEGASGFCWSSGKRGSEEVMVVFNRASNAIFLCWSGLGTNAKTLKAFILYQ